MKFVSKFVTGKQIINLVEFYEVEFYKRTNKVQQRWLGDDFKKILKEATTDNELVEIDETFYRYQNTKSVTDNNAMSKLKETLTDLGTPEGRLEARKRLGVMAYFLTKRPIYEVGEIIEFGNVIGWFKTKFGSLLVGYCYRSFYNQKCYCPGGSLGFMWGNGVMFWSRNGEA